ncbi:methyltransferase-like protein 13 [Mizuhopecten yessoensis]|uniref:Methyltransferase-like protein 13 n=1 Tax=Mizuhopecten yessoensis TaxID=6573 RepID=A0A210PU29_MIZYE|nr:methyltransferase-like protein 13 [Mizuhopecten yessoensis]OWF39956.1 Methyltransferase-like protein 13 [Mizuhopecten yessoensis]
MAGMNLLPRNHSEFHSPQYWDQFFQKRGTKAFEWYGEYPELCGILHKYIKPKDKLLMIGCGNSQLSENLYDVGYHNIINIDISDTVIRQMTDKNKKCRPDMKFVKMDVKKTDFLDGEFGVVLDKGTLDALMVDDSADVVADIDAMFTEIGRVLKQGGRYICISLLQDHIMNKVLQFFPDLGWPLRIHKVNTEDSENKDKEFNMPVFAVVLTKFKKLPNMKQILEVGASDDKVERMESTEKMQTVLKEMQYYALMRQQIKKREMVGEQVSLSLYSEVSLAPRYTLFIVDSADQKLANKFGIFIVPEGRETEWMFSTEEGRQQLSESAGFCRLVVITLNRAHTYETLDTIKSELSPHVLELAPPNFKSGSQVPYLSLGDQKGSRTVRYQGKSPTLGELVVEDVVTDPGQHRRRLVFTDSLPYCEARLKPEKKQKKGKNKAKETGKFLLDKNYLDCDYLTAMVAGLSFVTGTTDQAKECYLSDSKVLVIEGRNGGLPTFLHHNFPQMALTVLFPDTVMLQVATDWFSFLPDTIMQGHCDNPTTFISSSITQGLQVDAVVIDLDYLKSSLTMDSFLQESFLSDVKKLLSPNGVVVCKCQCDPKETKKTLLHKLSSSFPNIYSTDIEDTSYTVVIALMCDKNNADTLEAAMSNCKYLNNILGSKDKDIDIDLVQTMTDVTLFDP